MKRTKILGVFLLVFILLSSALVLASCGGEKEVKLTAPTVTLDGDTARWEADALADKFEISVSGNLSYIENSVTSRKLEDGQSFKIRAIGDGKKYTNSDWSNLVTYTAPEAPDEKYYTVTWKNGDTVIEVDENVPLGEMPTYSGVTPTKAPDAQYTYTFTGWTPELTPVSGDVTYTATFATEINTYTVVWKNGDTVLETDSGVPYGTVPTYDGANPEKAADAQSAYAFSGWSPTVSAVTDHVIYVAQFVPVSKNCTVIWKNGDTVLKTLENVPFGQEPTYDGVTPTKDATAQYTYAFSGWTAEIDYESAVITYYAKFNETVRKYSVTFYSEDGATVLDTVFVEYGAKATYSKALPVKNSTAEHSYVFDKWVTEVGGSTADDLTNVVSDRSVYASFMQSVRTVTVYVSTNNSGYGSVSTSQLVGISYGAEILVSRDTVTVNGQTVTAIAAPSTAQYTYTFTGWTAPATVGNDTVIIANFSRTLNTYTVTWKNGDTVLEVDENVAYGTSPVYNGSIPTKPSDSQYVYTFSGWTPEVTSVVGNVTYTAEFEDAQNKHVVTFYDEDGVTVLGVSVVSYGESASYRGALPTKDSTAQYTYTFDKWVSAKGASTEADLGNITRDVSVYASYTAKTRTYTVTFCDWDGTVLKTAEVAYGASAIAPQSLSRDGYKFVGWDKELSSITEDISATAKYVLQFTVNFVDYDNSIIDTQYVLVGEDATAPASPTRRNYRFTGWNTVFTDIHSDLTVKAEYIRQYKVTFVDAAGNPIKEQTVDEGAAASSPNAPSLEGYNFTGWDKAFENVLSDITVTAMYTVKTYTVKFAMPDGTVIGTTQIVEHGFSAIAPSCPEFILKGSGDYTKAYGFTGWNKSFDKVTENIVVEAVYTSDYKKPVIIVEFSGERNGDAKLYIYNSEELFLNAIEFTINYRTTTGKISINSATINSASPLWVEDSNGNNNNQYVINNNENIFTFAWADANGIQFDWCSKVITFNFSTDGATVGENTFVVESCSAVVSDSNGENLNKLTPVVIYR